MDLYMTPGSAPCRIVLLTGSALGLKFNEKMVNLLNGEHKKPEYKKINPQQTVPTLVDNGFILWESRVIATYLVDKYAKNEKQQSLYPKCAKQRAAVDRLLQFDLATLYSNLGAFFYPMVWGGVKSPDAEKLEKFKGSVTMLETFLGDNDYLTGDKVTLADLSVIASLSTLEVIDFDYGPWAKLKAWMDRMRALPYYKEANQKGVDMFKAFVSSKK